MNICPDCEGRRRIISIACPGYHQIVSPCRLCKGAGSVTAEQLTAVENGKAFRAYRVAQGLSQRQMAAAHNLSPQSLSKIEAGLLPLTESMQRELRRQRVAASALEGLAEKLQEGNL